MKKSNITLLAFACLASLISCNEKEDVLSEGYFHTKVSIAGASPTKATGVSSSEEDNVKSLQLIVFDENGNKEYYVNAGNSKTGEIITKDGKKTVMAIVNAPSVESAGSYSQLMGMTTLLSDNTLGSMVMTGEVQAVIQSGGELSIPVSRIISKVMIKKITSAFKSSTLSSKEFKIKSIYLINVAGDNKYSATASPSIWYNKLSEGRNDPSCSSFSLLSDPVNSVIAPKSSYTKEHSFFCYPNLTADESFDSTWSPRHTMLVIDALLGGEQTYYPIELPVIGRNKCIIIDELIVTRKGSDYPYIPVSDGTCAVTVEIVPWDVILQRTETI